MNKIVFAGGCFWGVEAYFNKLKGVTEAISVYVNGNKDNPTYEEVCNGIATHAEGVLVKYDNITLDELLNHFFRFVDPYSINKQGNDVGNQYRSGIYYYDDKDKEVILKYISKLQSKTSKKIVVEVKKVFNIFIAEDYHQKYLDKNPGGYCHVDLNLITKDEMKD